MTDYMSVTGVVATEPRSILTAEGLAICSFRMASPQRHFSKVDNAWIDGETNWYTVSTFRQLAEHAASSLRKGERVVVRGRLRLRQWERDDKSGLSAEIEAESLGHDLRWGTSAFARAEGTDRVESDGQESSEFVAEIREPEKVPF
jgi:single-strand DNA-binding protein